MNLDLPTPFSRHPTPIPSQPTDPVPHGRAGARPLRGAGRLEGVEIALGSTNAVKVLALRWAFERLGLDV